MAIKTLNVSAGSVHLARALDALRQDAYVMMQVVHPNVVRVYAWLTFHGQHFLVMQYVSGGSLADVLKNEGPLDWQRAARFVADVGEGLKEVHARGIIHRDIKPANILREPELDEALLSDFGVAAHLADAATFGGSLAYKAPEAFDGPVSPSLDVYSLAATFFHLVTGSTPFPGVKFADLQDQIRRGLPVPDPRCSVLPEPIERIIRAGLTANPGQRPGLKEFVTTLRASLNQLMDDLRTASIPRGKFAPSSDSTRISLIVRLRDTGDQQAWEEFYARYAPMIRGWCRWWFPRETEDMVHEVMLQLVKHVRTLDYEPDEGRFRGYLKTITHNLMANLKKKQRAAGR